VKKTKHLLIELPTADEIDQLAVTSPKFEIRQMEFDMGGKEADLDYTPCKGQVILVARGEQGIPLVRKPSGKDWSLPTDRIGPNENIEKSARRVAREQCGIMLRSIELAAIYDVVWHFSNISIKRLHVVYAGTTDDTECKPEKSSVVREVRFFMQIPVALQKHQVHGHALTDCSGK